MLRKSIIWVCLVSFVLATAGIAFAAAVKVILSPYPADDPIEPDATGRAVLNYAKGKDKTEVQVNCWGLTPNSDYRLWLYLGGWKRVDVFTTDEDGEGHLHAKLSGDVSGATKVAVNTAPPEPPTNSGKTVLLWEAAP